MDDIERVLNVDDFEVPEQPEEAPNTSYEYLTDTVPMCFTSRSAQEKLKAFNAFTEPDGELFVEYVEGLTRRDIDTGIYYMRQLNPFKLDQHVASSSEEFPIHPEYKDKFSMLVIAHPIQRLVDNYDQNNRYNKTKTIGRKMMENQFYGKI
eukprot:UN28436